MPRELAKTKSSTIFHDVAKALTSSLDLDSILQTIMEKMAEYFRPDTWSLLMVDEEQNELYFAIAVGDKAEALKNVRLKVGEGIAGWVAQHGEQQIVPDVSADPRFAKRVDKMTKMETQSIICVPLRSKHRVLGVIQLVNVDMKGFKDGELFFLNSLSDYAAIAIENARAVEKIQELTITDDCTGLYNARHLHKTLETEVYRSSRFAYEFSVLFIDLDHFQESERHAWPLGRQQIAGRDRISHQGAVAIDRLRVPLRRRRIRDPAAANRQGAGRSGRQTSARSAANEHVLPGRKAESKSAGEHGAIDVSP